MGNGFVHDGKSRLPNKLYENRLKEIYRRCEECGELHNKCKCEKEVESEDSRSS